MYGTHTKNLETFPKTQINNHGNDKHGGIIWEWDPVRHRKVAKQLSPGFSGRALRAKEATIHKYVDLLIGRLKEFGNSTQGVQLDTWINWLSVDMAADMAYNRELKSLENMEDPPYLVILKAMNFGVSIIQTCWRFPLLEPLKYAYFIFKSKRSHANIRAHSKQLLEKRIRLQGEGKIEHTDFFEYIIPPSREPPTDKLEMRHLEQVAGQLLAAGYEPPSLWFYFTIFYLLQNKKALSTVTSEIRTAFSSYSDITASTAAELPYLGACLHETLRLMPVIPNGMPVVSPGAMVDGIFIPKGTVCQSSFVSCARDPRNFHLSHGFLPERWLPQSHALYSQGFTNDARDGIKPFSQGPRACPGKEIAWWESRIFVAKTLWSFDLLQVDREGYDIRRDLKAWLTWVKPDIRVRFVPRTQ